MVFRSLLHSDTEEILPQSAKSLCYLSPFASDCGPLSQEGPSPREDAATIKYAYIKYNKTKETYTDGKIAQILNEDVDLSFLALQILGPAYYNHSLSIPNVSLELTSNKRDLLLISAVSCWTLSAATSSSEWRSCIDALMQKFHRPTLGRTGMIWAIPFRSTKFRIPVDAILELDKPSSVDVMADIVLLDRITLSLTLFTKEEPEEERMRRRSSFQDLKLRKADVKVLSIDQTVAEACLAAIRGTLEQSIDKYQVSSIVCTGHAHGGEIASLLALLIDNDLCMDHKDIVVNSITFGSASPIAVNLQEAEDVPVLAGLTMHLTNAEDHPTGGALLIDPRPLAQRPMVQAFMEVCKELLESVEESKLSDLTWAQATMIQMRKELLAKLGLVYPLGHLTLLHSSLGKSGQATSLRHVRQHFHKKFRVLRKNGDMRMYFDGIGQWWSEASAELGREVEKKPTAMEDYLSASAGTSQEDDEAPMGQIYNETRPSETVTLYPTHRGARETPLTMHQRPQASFSNSSPPHARPSGGRSRSIQTNGLPVLGFSAQAHRQFAGGCWEGYEIDRPPPY